MSKQYRYIRLGNIEKYEGWELVEIIPAKFEGYYDMAVMCNGETLKNDELQAEIKALQNALDYEGNELHCARELVNGLKAELEFLKTREEKTKADVVEVKHGHWISLEAEIGLFSCSECEHKILREETNFCPNCGAKMYKDGDSDD